MKNISGSKGLALLVIFFILYIPFLVDYGWGFRNIPNIDLPSFYAASVSVFQHGESPYDLQKLHLLMGTEVFVRNPYLYPPPNLLLIYPLASLSYRIAHNLFLVINHLVFLILIWLIPMYLIRPQADRKFTVFVLCLVYSLKFHPVIPTLNHGQVNIVLLAFIFLFWFFARKENSVLAAVFLALAILLKTYPLILIPLLFLIRRWRESVYTLAWLALATVFSYVILPHTIWHDWIVNVLPTGGYTRIPAGLFSPASVFNQNLNGFITRAFTVTRFSSTMIVNPDLARLLTYSLAGIVAVVTGMAAWCSFRIHNDSLDRTILVFLPGMYLIAPFSWEHHLVYLLPSILMLLTSRSKVWSKHIFYPLCIASALLIGMPNMLPYKFYGVVVLWMLCLFTACTKDIELTGVV
ncbi:DUF2029 domain-containing protein [bacterium]|nr:DUF2029 domain-containing protein [bacterium]